MPRVFSSLPVVPILPTEDTFRLEVENELTSTTLTIHKPAMNFLLLTGAWPPVSSTKSDSSIAIAILPLVVLTTRLLKRQNTVFGYKSLGVGGLKEASEIKTTATTSNHLQTTIPISSWRKITDSKSSTKPVTSETQPHRSPIKRVFNWIATSRSILPTINPVTKKITPTATSSK